MKHLLILLSIFCSGLSASAQNEVLIGRIEEQVAVKETEIEGLLDEIEHLKMSSIIEQLQASGLPSDNGVSHSAMILSFDEAEHQARWVAHMILPEVAAGRVSRTNDFRDDPLVEGEAVEADYFLKELQADSSYVYDGFGYDRGHLAPSADFRWSRKALSESYFYSNMSPQHADFNREDWAELEAILRAYVVNNEVPLYVVTMPIISEGHEVIERGKSQLAVPQQFLKLAFDAKNGRGIAFLMESRKSDHDLADFAISIDRAEEIVELDFFSELELNHPVAETGFDLTQWLPSDIAQGVAPLYAPSLPSGYINTTQAQRWMGSKKKVHVCGTVVSTRFSGSGNYWLNVDKKFPNTVFSVYVRKNDFKNFDSIHQDYLIDERVCFYGQVREMFSLPSMNITRQEEVSGVGEIK